MPRSRKDIAIQFLKLCAGGKPHEAFREHAAAGVRHHNPWYRGDWKSLADGMAESAKANPGTTVDVKHALEDGDVVAIHSHVKHRPSDKGFAVVHLFRFTGEQVVELWDVPMAVPESSPNEHGVF